jgi:hypothetical protein
MGHGCNPDINVVKHVNGEHAALLPQELKDE